MTALTGPRNTPSREATVFQVPLAATAKIFTGAMVMLDGDGNAVPASTAVGLTPLGRAEDSADNGGGVAGAATVEVRRGCFRWANDGTAPVTRAHVGGPAYAVDDQTVASTDGTGTRSACGTIRDLDAQGVWVEV